MMKGSFVYILLLPLFMGSCASYKLSDKSKNEQLILQIKENKEMFESLKLPVQEKVQKTRGLDVISLVSQALSLSTDLVKMVIDKEKAKYAKEYQLAVGQNYFYKEISTNGPLDPKGLQFEGIEILRLFSEGESENPDTALYILLELDTSKPAEIINNSYFRLKAKEVKINYAKVKIPDSRWYMPWSWYYKGEKNKKINLDFELKIHSTWITEAAEIKSNVEIGSFFFSLRDAVPGKTYVPVISGYSFLVPRSSGFYKNSEEEVTKCFGQGLYTVSANITEAWKSDLITTTVHSNADIYVKDLSDMLIRKLK